MIQTNANVGNMISYSGQVTASLSVKGTTVKFAVLNSGTKYLWDTLAMALAGYDIETRIPKYLDVVDENSTSVLLNKIMFRGVVWGDVVNNTDPTYSAVRFTSTITSADKRVNTVSGPCRLRMFSSYGDGKQYLAEIQDKDKKIRDLFNAIDVGSNAIIEWELRFQNQTTSVSPNQSNTPNEGGNS